MNLASMPVFDRLAGSKVVLLAGAGGGFDVFAGIPIYVALQQRDVKVHLANLSFTALDRCTGRAITPTTLEVRADSEGWGSYFPEKHLCEWLRHRGDDDRVFAFSKTGVVPLRGGYQALVNELDVDTIVLVDGGSDSLLRGDEAGLGTPTEDMTSIAAVMDVEHVSKKLLLSIGFGVDAFHDVCHAHVLESIARIAKTGGYLGAFSLLREMPEFEAYKTAVELAFAAMPEQPSIVNASIVSAVEGEYGDVHRTNRTKGSTLFINPLMGMYFGFELEAVARNIGYLSRIKSTQTMFEVSAIIDAYQHEVARLRGFEPIPI